MRPDRRRADGASTLDFAIDCVRLGWRLRNATVKSDWMTKGELAAISAALGNTLEADDYAGAVGPFGSPQGVAAAERALAKIRAMAVRKDRP